MPKRILNENIDEVSCSGSSRLTPDGRPDLVIKFEVTGWSKFLAFGRGGLRLERKAPPGLYTSVIGAYPIALLDDGKKTIYNVLPAVFPEILVPQELFISVCPDGYETPDTQYRLLVDFGDRITATEYFKLRDL
ncbi:MAG: hypothetical protein ACRERV_00480 [Methylococcales bacterium]